MRGDDPILDQRSIVRKGEIEFPACAGMIRGAD